MKNIVTILCLLGVLSFTNIYGQNEKFKALFIYNFTNYIDWPQNGATSFVIAIIGDSPVFNEIEAISKIKTIDKLPIVVKKINTVNEIGNASIIYIPPSKKKTLVELAQFCTGKPVLIISDEAVGNFGINLILINEKQSFQISKSNIESHGLKVNSTLIALGKIVN